MIESRLNPGVMLYLILAISPILWAYSGGTGEPNDPYQIATAADLLELGESTGDYSKAFVLVADVNFSEYDVFQGAVIAAMKKGPRGVDIPAIPFTGQFDGQNYVIRNVKIEGDAGGVGFWGLLSEGAMISRLGLEDVYVQGETHCKVGGLVGRNLGGHIVSCYTTGTVRAGEFSDEDINLLGRENISVRQVISSQYQYTLAGGLVGKNFGGIIDSCYSSAQVLGVSYLGGLVGGNAGGSVLESFTCGTVSGTSKVGGLAGYNLQGAIEFCYSRASVFSKRTAGGLVGVNEEGYLSCCFSMGLVEGDVIGGLVGNNYGWISDCQNYSLCSGGSFVGGLAGSDNSRDADMAGEIYNCLSVGRTDLYSEWGGHLGALVGYSTYGVIANSFWDVESSGATTVCGVDYYDGLNVKGMTTSELMNNSLYLSSGWDFVDEVENGINDYWQSSNNTYPILNSLADAYPREPNGLGTFDSPYIINTTTELESVGFRPISCYQLGRDLECNDLSWSTSVIPWFGGHFDGNCLSIENLCIQGDRYLGLFGVVGPNGIVDNVSLKNVTVQGTGECVAGLVASNDGEIRECSSSGCVIGKSQVGGLVASNRGTISDTWSNVSVDGESQVGGLIAYNAGGAISSSYSNGAVAGNEFVGGLLGYNEGAVTACFWDIETSGLEVSAGGVGLGTAEMKDVNTYLNAGWDFVDESINGEDDIWFMLEDSYPLFPCDID